MKKNSSSRQIWIFLGIMIIAGSFLLFFAGGNRAPSPASGGNNSASTGSLEIQRILVSGHEIIVKVARTEAERNKGLSGHEPLGPNEGMIFLFEQPGAHGIWMKDMLFPIDIIWLATADEEGATSIVHIEKNVSPDTYPFVFTPSGQAQYVLEVGAGTADKYGWQADDKVNF